MNSSTQNTRLVVDPRDIKQTRRRHGVRNITSMKAGVIAPIARIPMLRNDALKAKMRVKVEMLETKELLMNPVNLRITAYLWPWSAAERFQKSMDQFNRSYVGEPQVDGGSVVPFFETHAFGAHGANGVYKALGLPGNPTDQVVTMDLEAYNAVVNFRRKNRSPDLPQRGRLDATLAEAFWEHAQFQHVVPSFDNDLIDGEVALNVVAGRLEIQGIAGAGSPLPSGTSEHLPTVGGLAPLPGGSGAKLLYANFAGTSNEVFAEMRRDGITVSLSNIEMAEKAQWFAKFRTRYAGHEEWVKDMLMDGLEIPDLALTQPILLANKVTRFSQAKRYASDSGNLTDSAVSGGAVVDLTLRVPKLPVGGIVMVFAEAVPEQMWERQRDPLFHLKQRADAMGQTNLVDALPKATRDALDPEKVDIIFNGDVDAKHGTPGGTFGYLPGNGLWDGVYTRAGGKFLRPTVDSGTDDARQRFYASEDLNPSLGESFYLVKNLHQKPFIENDVGFEPFEIVTEGMAVLTGDTQFGGMLIEATDDYEKVMAQAPTERIEQTE